MWVIDTHGGKGESGCIRLSVLILWREREREFRGWGGGGVELEGIWTCFFEQVNGIRKRKFSWKFYSNFLRKENDLLYRFEDIIK